MLRKLLADADVLVQNFRPGAMARMGFSEAQVRDINPKIIYASLSGFGSEGPYAGQRVYDPVILAVSGVTDIQRNKETGEPQMINLVVADKITALVASQAITAALLARATTGEGQSVDLAMLNAMVSVCWPEGMIGLTYEEQQFDVTEFVSPTSAVYPTTDGHITTSCVSDAEWQGICHALNKPEWIDDERFKDIASRSMNAGERKALMSKEIAKFSTEEMLSRLA